MAVIRVQKTENYTVMSNHHLRNKDMSLKAKGLMSLMLSLPPSWDYSIGGLVAICKESHTSIRSALKELEQNQYLVRERKNNEKGYFTYEYILYEVPEPYVGNQHTGSAHTETAHTESDIQINKDELNTDKLNKKELNKDIYINEYENILKHIKDIELKHLYYDYIEMRSMIDAPISKRGLSMLINRCARLSNFDKKKEKLLLETAIINNWKNVYEPKGENEPRLFKRDDYNPYAD
ncbi:MAG: hypothetical protein IKY67_06665 [Paludibacteraceae bacterium]|nr:hypothetical protein [Paludibacteraceae bacterium]